jgi:transcriptional antiterminator RfaH
MSSWILVHSKPHKEAFLWGELNARQIDSYYPQIRVKPVNPRARKIQPYFPGYLFVNIDVDSDQFKELPWLPGSVGWVRFGDEPAMVPETIIQGIRRHVDELNQREIVERKSPFQHGELVEIVDGPFAEYEALFDTAVSGKERVRVLLQMVKSQQVLVELPTDMLRRKKRA